MADRKVLRQGSSRLQCFYLCCAAVLVFLSGARGVLAAKSPTLNLKLYICAVAANPTPECAGGEQGVDADETYTLTVNGTSFTGVSTWENKWKIGIDASISGQFSSDFDMIESLSYTERYNEYGEDKTDHITFKKMPLVPNAGDPSLLVFTVSGTDAEPYIYSVNMPITNADSCKIPQSGTVVDYSRTVSIALAVGIGGNTGPSSILTNHLMTDMVSATDCALPSEVKSFSNESSGNIYSWFKYDNANGEKMVWKWYDPSGALAYTGTLNLAYTNGCASSSIPASGQSAGAWSVEIYANGVKLATDSFTVSKPGGGCPITRTMGNGAHIQSLRQLRDAKLDTAIGAMLTAFYYNNSNEINGILTGNDALRARFRHIIGKNLPAAKSLVQHGAATISSDELLEMYDFLTDLKAQANLRLHCNIDFVLRGMESGWLLQCMGITVQ